MHTAAMRVAFLQSLFQQSWYNYCYFQRAIVQELRKYYVLLLPCPGLFASVSRALAREKPKKPRTSRITPLERQSHEVTLGSAQPQDRDKLLLSAHTQ